MKRPARSKADLIVAAAQERKAMDLVLLKVDKLTSITDYFLICSGRSSRQVQALAEHIRESVKKSGGHRPLGIEGQGSGQWILMDYDEVIVHIFYEPVREFYDIEGLWIDAERIDLPPAAPHPDDSKPSRRKSNAI